MSVMKSVNFFFFNWGWICVFVFGLLTDPVCYAQKTWVSQLWMMLTSATFGIVFPGFLSRMEQSVSLCNDPCLSILSGGRVKNLNVAILLDVKQTL